MFVENTIWKKPPLPSSGILPTAAATSSGPFYTSQNMNKTKNSN